MFRTPVRSGSNRPNENDCSPQLQSAQGEPQNWPLTSGNEDPQAPNKINNTTDRHSPRGAYPLVRAMITNCGARSTTRPCQVCDAGHNRYNRRSDSQTPRHAETRHAERSPTEPPSTSDTTHEPITTTNRPNRPRGTTPRTGGRGGGRAGGTPQQSTTDTTRDPLQTERRPMWTKRDATMDGQHHR